MSIDEIDHINSINTRNKLKDRISAIYAKGGKLEFYKVEKTTLEYNLDLVDSMMAKLIAMMLLEFHQNHINGFAENLSIVFEKNAHLFKNDLNVLQIKSKHLLIDILLGFFAGSKWNGFYSSNGIIVVKNDGSQVAYHITDCETLANYLFQNIRFDTPSTTRHRYGSLIIENGELYFKLNLQLRFSNLKK